MKTEDLNQFKGSIKSALQDWGNAKIDELLPNSAAPRAFLKNGLNNLLSRYDAAMDRWIDSIFLFVADESGAIDSDVMVDNIAGIFKEMPDREYSYGPVGIKAAKGTVEVCFPHNLLIDMLFGDMGSVKFSTEDILELKEFFV